MKLEIFRMHPEVSVPKFGTSLSTCFDIEYFPTERVISGYSQFNQIRREVREKRERMIRDQANRRQKFLERIFWSSMLIITMVLAYMVFA